VVIGTKRICSRKFWRSIGAMGALLAPIGGVPPMGMWLAGSNRGAIVVIFPSSVPNLNITELDLNATIPKARLQWWGGQCTLGAPQAQPKGCQQCEGGLIACPMATYQQAPPIWEPGGGSLAPGLPVGQPWGWQLQTITPLTMVARASLVPSTDSPSWRIVHSSC